MIASGIDKSFINLFIKKYLSLLHDKIYLVRFYILIQNNYNAFIKKVNYIIITIKLNKL